MNIKLSAKKILIGSLIFAFLLSASVADAAAFTSGPSSGTTISNVNTGGQNWRTPNNAQSSDNQYATSSLSVANDMSDALTVEGLGFSIPSDALIDGIEVSVERSASVANTIRLQRLRMLDAGSATGTALVTGDTYTWGTSDSIATYGGSTELWGTTWTPSQINGSNFGVRLFAQHKASGAASIAQIDQVTIKVYYTIPPPTISVTTDISTSTPTNLDITATATTTGTGVLDFTTHTFTANGSFAFTAVGAGGTTTATTTITNIDKEAPVINPHADITGVEATSASGAVVNYTASSTDNTDPSPVTTCLASSGSTFALGTTGVICNAQDAAGNNATSTSFNIVVVDTTAPVISITGSSTVTVQAGVPYVDAGAVAVDNSGDFAASSTDNVDTNTLGSYTVTYTATDASGNSATSTSRTVNVVDTTAPGAPSAVAPLGGSIYRTSSLTNLDWTDVSDFSSPVSYSYQLATNPALNGNGSFSFPTATGNLLTQSQASTTLSSEGVYYYIARATDNLGNIGEWMAPVSFRIDNTPPVITVTGSGTVTIEGGSVYTDLGAIANDDIDGSFTATSTGTVDTSIVGTYVITYTAEDTAGNEATSTTRTVYVVDTTAPVIHVTGADPVTVEGTVSPSSYVDAGATATDNVAAPVTVTSTGTVNTHVVGSYTITYNAVDNEGNAAATTTRTVNVVDTTAPVIHVTGANPIIFTINNPYTEIGATASDAVDGAVTPVPTGTVDTAILGNYIITYTATDSHSNVSTSTRTVTVIPPDTTAPVITLLGSTPVTVEGGDTYTDAGATASDNVNGNITSAIVTVNPVNTLVIASYSVTYNVADGAGNPADQVTRTVNVVDTTAPVITLIGGDMSLHTGDVFTDPGSVTNDIIDGVSTSTATVTGTVNTSATSTTVLTYDAVDSHGNNATPVTRTVTVVDVSVPVITLLGNNSVDVEVGTIYEDAGATSTDDVDGDITANIVTGGLPIVTTTLGDHTVTYDVTDSSSNPAVQITRTVHVVDTTAPVVTVTGSSTVSIIVGGTYEELGATATDNYDEGVTASTTDTVDTETLGTYEVTYSSTDSSENTGTSTRTVHVVGSPLGSITVVKNVIDSNGNDISDTQPFTVVLGGESTMTVAEGSNAIYTNLTPGLYTLTENSASGYDLVSIANDDDGEAAGVQILVQAGTTTVATVTNRKQAAAVPETNNSGARTGGSTSGGSTPPPSTSGQVLGASTTPSTIEGGSCGAPYLSSFMRYGRNNNVEQVKKLQTFLNQYLKLNIPVTGYFGQRTLAAVKQFQLQEAEHILKPWGLTVPTGYVYRTTMWWINSLVCPSGNYPAPTV